jgi:D-inositol-3-phosphate glycosyltransferase
VIGRVAYLTVHTSPLEQPGSGNAGGMNVYLHELAAHMARRGVAVDVYTRRTSPDQAEVVEVERGYRVVHVDAGPPTPLPVLDLPEYVGEFAEGVIKRSYTDAVDYELVHSHYWLSGWAGVLVKEALDIPLANSFHTLGRVKDLTRPPQEAPSGLLRIAAERDVIARSDCVVASTPAEAEDLLEHYAARPEALCVSPPGIDHEVFSPGSRAEARAKLRITADPVLLFAGRIQPLKALDVAVEATAALLDRFPGLKLVAVGGASGPGGAAEVIRIRELIERLGLEGTVELRQPVPHRQLVHWYRAADVLVVPSRSESFGLVAAEAQAAGTPVVASRVGGLAYAVDDGASGILVDGWDPADYAAAVASIIDDSQRARSLVAGAIEFGAKYSWPAAVDRFLELYDGITGGGDVPD